MQKLNSILLLDRTGKKCEFGIYDKRPLSYLSSKLNLYIPFFYYDNFNYRKGLYYVLIDLDKVLNLIKV